MADPVFIGQQLLVVGGIEQVLHILFADGDAAVDHVALQALDEHLPADVLPEFPVAHAVLDQCLLEFLHRHLVLLGESEHRAGEGLVIDLHAAAHGLLHLDVLQDQPLHELVEQHVPGRRVHALARDLVPHRVQAAQQFRGQNDVFVDDGDDGVEFLVLGLGAAAEQGAKPERQNRCQSAPRGGRALPGNQRRGPWRRSAHDAGAATANQFFHRSYLLLFL